MKYLVLLITSTCLIISCEKKDASSEAQKYQVKLKMKEVIFYGDTITFEPSDTTFIIANTRNVTEINLHNGSPFGVKVNVFAMQGDRVANHAYQVIFYEKVFGNWDSLNSPQMLGKLILEKTYHVRYSMNDYFGLHAECVISIL